MFAVQSMPVYACVFVCHTRYVCAHVPVSMCVRGTDHVCVCFCVCVCVRVFALTEFAFVCVTSDPVTN